ncbi:MAG: S24 family peptidase [Proteobacteria bacterium]|nr:S24 family peptidase [Pseudomonadota bacterium]
MKPDFIDGMILIVEPDMSYLPNDFVIVKNGDEATFKQVIKDGSDWYLKPLNPRYLIKSLGDARIMGVV